MIIRLTALLLAAFSLWGCGFAPLYGETDGGGVANALRGIEVGRLSGPASARRFVGQELGDRLPADSTERRYRLDLTLADSRRAVAVTVSSATTRFDYELKARYALTDLVTGDVHRATIEAISSYGVVENQYASLVGREDSIRRASVELARKIELDLALYLAGRPAADNTVILPEEVEDGTLEGATLSDPGAAPAPETTGDEAPE